MTKSNGIKSLKQAAKLLNKHAPDGESLAYINKDEAKLLRAHGGSGIMTLQGVPTYGPWDWITTAAEWVGDKAGDIWEGVTGAYKDKPILNKAGKAILDIHGNPVIQQGRSIVGDALSVWAALRAKKDKEGLNAAEMEQFNKLNQQLAAAETEFDVGTDFGTQLKAPQYTTDVADVAAYTPIDFSGSTTPDLTLDAKAYGGRIGYNLGGIDRPFQGIGALNPRMGYAQGVGPMGRPMGPGVSENLEFVDKIFSDEAKTLAGMSGKPGGLLQETKYDRDTNTRDFTFSEDITMPGQEHTRETLDAANQMLDIQEMKKLQLEKLALKKGWTKEQFDKRYWELVKRQRGGPEGWGPYTQYDDLNEALSMLEYDIGVWSNWEGDQDPESVDMRLQDPNYLPLPSNFTSSYEPNAHGGRIGAQEGGIMPLLNLGGMEKDYRQDGGFVPIGRKEKADDVPARLSKNEFVFTADAVRAAGGGDIDEGAQRMYNVMKNLEAGGDISEQSQGKA